MICSGRVVCNGAVASLGDSADPDTDEILVDGCPIPQEQKPVYIMLNKPRGYVTTLSDEKGRKSVQRLVAGCAARVYPVGRLDMDSDGLLLLTNDGDITNRLTHPKHLVDRTYRVSVSGYSENAFRRLSKPMQLDGYLLQIPKLQLIVADTKTQKATFEMTIHEGRNRQIRRMCAIAGMRVTRLTRVSHGNVSLGDLPTGKWRYLTETEIQSLMPDIS